MKLDQLLAKPGWVAGAKNGDVAALRDALDELPAAPPLLAALERARASDAVRYGLICERAGILDLGHEQVDPGLVLGLPSPASGPGKLTWIAWGLERPAVNLFLASVLRRFTSQVRRAVRDGAPAAALASPELRDSEIEANVRVEHVLTPLSYRVYPDTPVAEVQNLMLRRDVAAVPVVGESLEVLGLITASDILPHAMPGGEGGEGGERRRPPTLARHVMTRSVFCVSDGESLVEAGRALVARNLAQLPVVRGGEIVGFLERATVMRAFLGPSTE